MTSDFLGEEHEEENETLRDEIIAINSIYGQDTIRPMVIDNKQKEKNIYILHLPHLRIWLQIKFSPNYPYCCDNDEQQKDDEQGSNDDRSTQVMVVPPIRALGTHGCGSMVRKGDATQICQKFEQLARQLYRPGDVCLFDIMEELMNNGSSDCKSNEYSNRNENNIKSLLSSKEKEFPSDDFSTKQTSFSALEDMEKISSIVASTSSKIATGAQAEATDFEKRDKKMKGKNKNIQEDKSTAQQQMKTPKWFISEPIRELKSLFLAHCTFIHFVNDVARFRNLLLEHEDKKKLNSATHNIMAWRIRYHDGDNNGIVVHRQEKKSIIANSTSKFKNLNPHRYKIDEDYDDDGESAAGARLLHLMRLMDVWNVLVIVSRWYGGVNLGPRRFAIINSVARDAILKATASSTPSKQT
ncbi:putative impact family protein [Erysiphe necator]|uniref:Putative impact family protein n=1 Tax=Uncinula necator TaxID=52586 RepID=A0A0B1P3L0_UNCNE|nr:putative impact family protein [Erysiphe necator]